MSLSPDHPVAVLISIVRSCWRQKFKALLAFIAIGATSFAVWWNVPRTYESEARLFVRVGRETIGLDPTATVGQTLGMQDSRETEINSMMEVLKSRSLHAVIVDELGVEQVLGLSSTVGESIASTEADSKWRLASFTSTAPHEESSASPLRERAIQQIGKSLTITSPRRSTVISIAGEAESPLLAQHIVGSLVSAYKKEHILLHQSPGSFDFFTDRAARSEQEVKDALKALNEAKSELSIATVQGRRDSLAKQISGLEEQAQTVAANLDSARAKVAALETVLAELPAEIAGISTSGFNNDAHTRMREQLFVLEIRERDLLSKYREAHPAVVAHRKQVEDARRILAEQPAERSQQEMLPNPAVKSVELDLVKERAEFAALEAKSKTLAEQTLSVAEELRELNHNELRMADLERELDERKAAHTEAITRLEQARINHEMEDNRLSNINVIQEATLVEKPKFPRLSLFAAAGLLAACFGAVSLALAWDLAFPPIADGGAAAHDDPRESSVVRADSARLASTAAPSDSRHLPSFLS